MNELKISDACLVDYYETPTRRVNNRVSSMRNPHNRDKMCVYRKALFNTLERFRPKVCIEIGTHTGNTTKVFQDYFDRYRPDGVLITCDIKKFADFSNLKNVRQVLVAHHTENVQKFHPAVTDAELVHKPSESVKTNIDIIRKELLDAGEELADFAFVDGDHQTQSIINDMAIVEALLKDPKLILIDDTKEEIHECSLYYETSIRGSDDYIAYDFDDWKQFVGCSLVMKKQK